MPYFIYFGGSNCPKNNYQQVTLTLLNAISNVVVSDLESTKNNIANAIIKLHDQFPRCKALKPSWWKGDDNWRLSLGPEFSVQFSMYPIKEDLPNALQ